MKINPQNDEKFKPKPLAAKLSPKRIRIINMIRQKTIEKANKQFKAEQRQYRQQKRQQKNNPQKQQTKSNKKINEKQTSNNILQKQTENAEKSILSNLIDAHMSKSLRDQNKKKKVSFDLKKNQTIQNTANFKNNKSILTQKQSEQLEIQNKQKKTNNNKNKRNSNKTKKEASLPSVSESAQLVEQYSQLLQLQLQIKSKQSKSSDKQSQKAIQNSQSQQKILMRYIIPTTPHIKQLQKGNTQVPTQPIKIQLRRTRSSKRGREQKAQSINKNKKKLQKAQTKNIETKSKFNKEEKENSSKQLSQEFSSSGQKTRRYSRRLQTRSQSKRIIK